MDLEWLNELPVFDKRQLSPHAQLGLSAARAIQSLRGNECGPAIRELADRHGCDPSTIRRWIYKARLELTREPGRCKECDRALFHGSRGWHRSGAFPATLQLLLAAAILGLPAAPRRACLNPLRRGR